MELAVERRALRFRAPLAAAHGELRERELLEVRLRAPDGVEGVGEAAPLEPYDGVSLAAVARGARGLPAGASAGAGEASVAEALAACRAATDLPQALAAVDLALWDIAGRRAGRPVARPAAPGRRSPRCRSTRWCADAEEAAAAAARRAFAA